MRTIELDAIVTEDGKLTADVPPDVLPGRHRVVITVIDTSTVPQEQLSRITFSAHDIGPWPEGLSLRREDMYGDDGR
jgi:hypothetical protein